MIIPTPPILTTWTGNVRGIIATRNRNIGPAALYNAGIRKRTLPTIRYDNSVSPLPRGSAIPSRYYTYATQSYDIGPQAYKPVDYWARVISSSRQIGVPYGVQRP